MFCHERSLPYAIEKHCGKSKIFLKRAPTNALHRAPKILLPALHTLGAHTIGANTFKNSIKRNESILAFTLCWAITFCSNQTHKKKRNAEEYSAILPILHMWRGGISWLQSMRNPNAICSTSFRDTHRHIQWVHRITIRAKSTGIWHWIAPCSFKWIMLLRHCVARTVVEFASLASYTNESRKCNGQISGSGIPRARCFFLYDIYVGTSLGSLCLKILRSVFFKSMWY